MTIPAIAPPDIPELLEEALTFARLLGLLVAVAALPVGAFEAVVVPACVPVVVAEEELVVDEVAPAKLLVLNGVGAVVCDVAVTLLTPSASKYTEFALLMLTPEFGDVKLLMQMLI